MRRLGMRPLDNKCLAKALRAQDLSQEEEEMYTHRIERAFREYGVPMTILSENTTGLFKRATGNDFWAEGAFLF